MSEKTLDNIERYRVVGTPEAAAFCNFSLPHFRRLYRAGTVPAPIRISQRKLGWRIGDLADWLASAPKSQFGKAA